MRETRPKNLTLTHRKLTLSNPFKHSKVTHNRRSSPTARHHCRGYHKVISSSDFPQQTSAEAPKALTRHHSLATSCDPHREKIAVCHHCQALLHSTTKASPTSPLQIHSMRIRDTSQESSETRENLASSRPKACRSAINVPHRPTSNKVVQDLLGDAFRNDMTSSLPGASKTLPRKETDLKCHCQHAPPHTHTIGPHNHSSADTASTAARAQRPTHAAKRNIFHEANMKLLVVHHRTQLVR